MQIFDVWLGSKKIDTVHYNDSPKVLKDEVYRSLVNHDGYNPEIRISKRRSKKFPLVQCADCGEVGKNTGHMDCQYPQNH